MKATEIIGRPILDLTTATTVGKVDDVVIDATTRRVAGLRLAKATTTGDWLAWDRIGTVGADAVTIADADAVATFDDTGSTRGLRATGALGGRVLTDEGREIGRLGDLEFTDDGDLTAVLVDTATLAPDALLGIGAYATVVHDPAP